MREDVIYAKVLTTTGYESFPIRKWTAKAVLIDLGHKEIWIPRSQCEIELVDTGGELYYKIIPADWLITRIETDMGY